MEWPATLTVLALLPLLYIFTASTVQVRFPMLRNKRICLLIAHPDDEAMFFAPTLLALTRPDTGNHVKILCLSNGNAEGLGEVRRLELLKSALTLGLRREEDVFILDSPDFQDSMTAQWDAERISGLLASAFVPQPPKGTAKSASSEKPSATIDVLITFDAHGVSDHPNHKSLYHGARRFVWSLVQGKPGWEAPVLLYTLRTVPIWRKFTGIFDSVMTLGTWAATTDMKNKKHVKSLVFLNGLSGSGVGSAWKAMVTAHKSQMLWFRWGWILLSRYMYMNDLVLQKISSQAPLSR